MKLIHLAVAAALVTSLAACSDDDGDTEAAPTANTAANTSDSGADAAAGGTLMASIGDEGDPDAFTIGLSDSEGNDVTSLPAGEYEIQVSDPSAIHNFHLSGPGVDETTSVPETGTQTWTVTLEAGEYSFVCDPHPKMAGTFTVT